MKDRGNERIELLSPDETVKNVLIDLSFSGAAMNYATEQKKGGLVKVKISDFVLDATVIYCQGRASGYRVGVHFTKVPPEVQNSLKVLVDEFSRGVPIAFQIIEQDDKKKE